MLHTFSSDFVYHERVENFDLINNYFLSEIEKRRGNEETCWPSSHCNTSYHNEKSFNEFLYEENIVNNVLWKPIDGMMDKIGPLLNKDYRDPELSIIHDAWYNIYSLGQYQEIHNHVGPKVGKFIPSFSAIYIVKMDGKNDTVFTKPTKFMGEYNLNRENYDTSKVDEISVGSVIIFPSYLDHFVKPLQSKTERITISYNLYSKFSFEYTYF